MTCTVVVEIKYFCNKNVVTHTENCKLNLPLDCSTTQMEKNIRRMCGIDESSRRRGFADFANPNSHYKLPTSHVQFGSMPVLEEAMTSRFHCSAKNTQK